MVKLSELTDKEWKIVETIFSGFDGALIVDENGIITIFTEYYEKESGMKREDVLGKHVTEVFPHTRMMEVLKSGIPILADLWELNGKQQFVTRVPITSNGRIIGAAGISVFRYMDQARSFASQWSKLNSELAYYKETVKKLSGAKYSFAAIRGESNTLLDAKERARRVASSNTPVLIYGETGTGKELFAHAIHQESSRHEGPLVRVNCASIPESLMESEFFGYEEGAFSGARKGGKPGKFELAKGGSIFLDEVSDLPYHLQPKLLRVLQEKEFERVGGTTVVDADVRVISATNRDLRKLVASSAFREDLYYRLNVYLIRVPPLRERMEDLPLLVEHFIMEQNQENGTRIEGITKEAMNVLINYHWPGNVRELQICIERACLDAGQGMIKKENLMQMKKARVGDRTAAEFNLREVRERAEKQAIQTALGVSGGNRQRAADMLGIHRTSLHQKMKEYQLFEPQ
ncbi:MAG: sigma-54 interaction domain-containing protein [Methylocystaceae bacterium]